MMQAGRGLGSGGLHATFGGPGELKASLGTLDGVLGILVSRYGSSWLQTHSDLVLLLFAERLLTLPSWP